MHTEETEDIIYFLGLRMNATWLIREARSIRMHPFMDMPLEPMVSIKSTPIS